MDPKTLNIKERKIGNTSRALSPGAPVAALRHFPATFSLAALARTNVSTPQTPFDETSAAGVGIAGV